MPLTVSHCLLGYDVSQIFLLWNVVRPRSKGDFNFLVKCRKASLQRWLQFSAPVSEKRNFALCCCSQKPVQLERRTIGSRCRRHGRQRDAKPNVPNFSEVQAVTNRGSWTTNRGSWTTKRGSWTQFEKVAAISQKPIWGETFADDRQWRKRRKKKIYLQRRNVQTAETWLAHKSILFF